MEEAVEVAAYAMAKESDFVIRTYVDHLDAAGYSPIFLVLDGGASDGVREMLRRRPEGAAPLRLREYDQADWDEALGERSRDLTERLRHSIRRAYDEMDADWVLISDADEFVDAPRELFQLLAAAPPEVESVQLPPAEAVWGPGEGDAGPFETRVFRTQVRRRRAFRLLKRLIYGRYHVVFDDNMLSHKEGKQILRTGLRCDLITSHHARRDGVRLNRPVSELNGGRSFYIRHYDAISYDRWIEKFRRRTDQHTSHLRPQRYAQVELVRDLLRRMEAADSPEEARRIGEKVFRRLYHLTWFQYALLRLLGGVVRLPPARATGTQAAR